MRRRDRLGTTERRMVVGMLIEHRREQLWQAELARSGTHWRLLDEAARGLDHPALQARLEAVEALRDVAGDFPVLRAEIRGLLAVRLRERGAAYRDRTLPPDLREMRRFLHEPEEDVVGSWTPF